MMIVFGVRALFMYERVMNMIKQHSNMINFADFFVINTVLRLCLSMWELLCIIIHNRAYANLGGARRNACVSGGGGGWHK